jgi:3-dehydroquinate synthase
MVMASRLSVKKGLIKENDAERLRALLNKLGLPTEVHFDQKKVFEALRKDKKRDGNCINFVLLREIGDAVVAEISLEELEKSVDDWRQMPEALV